MATDIDVLRYLKLFAAKTKSGVIDYKTFSAQLQRQAMGADRTVPVFRDLAANPDVVLLPRLKKLEIERKIVINLAGSAVDSVVVPDYYQDLIVGEYRKIEENPDIPFPDEDNLKISIPSSWVFHISIDGLAAMIDNRVNDAAFHKLAFPDGLPGLVCPADYTPARLHELAVLKIRNYLRQGSNKDYIQKKLGFSFQNKETQLRDALNALMVKPYDAVKSLREITNDFAFPFWAYLTTQIRKDLSQKPEKTPEDVSVLQAAALCDVYGNYWKGKAQRMAERETALKTLAQKLHEPPYVFTLDDIVDFRDTSHRPLLGKYSREELEERLRVLTTEAKAGQLPELLTLVTSDAKRRFAAKDRILPLAVRFVGEARQGVRTYLVNEWRAVLMDLRSIPAMESDEAFRADLMARLDRGYPILSLLVRDGYLPLVYAEFKATKQAAAELGKFFDRGELVPIDELLGLHRKQLLSDVKMMMPLWYSIPILPALAKFFKAMFGGGKAAKRAKAAVDADGEAKKIAVPSAQARKLEFANAAAKVEKNYLPAGVQLEAHMAGLEARWNTMLDATSKRNLTEDVESLVRDYLRTMLRTMKPSEFTVERVKSLTTALADTPSLSQIRNRSALEDYMALYMILLMKK